MKKTLSKKQSLKDDPRATYANCEVYCEGMDMNCPMCGVLVKSGERHQCSKPKQESGLREGVSR